MVFRFTEGGKLLVIPQDGSHWLSMRSLVDKLSEKGHQIVIVVPEVTFHLNDIDHYTVKMFSGSYSKKFMESYIKEVIYDVFERKPILQNMKLLYHRIVNTTYFITSTCENFLSNETLIKYLETSNFDVMLSDPVFPCGEIIAEHLSIPSVFFMRAAVFSAEYYAAQSPIPPSYVPRFFTAYTDHMSFKERVINLLLGLTESMACKMVYAAFARIASEFLHRDVTVWDLFSRASIMMIRNDFVLDFPRPFMPNMVFIGGINCANRKLLNQTVPYLRTLDLHTTPSYKRTTGYW
ncbi:hypothetical protein GDO81_017292 [Engystomops pustulosus]|uniref:glucuronosyltransferase n=1 Tax=Engystomops pustulosus TaxID=76066 RepID=A0AAV7ACI1_ENGPU|nr:hypothetical protein GDO81_017292 [Engystomops pustulosus]